MVGVVLKVKARYEDEVLKPWGKLDLKEGVFSISPLGS